MKTKKTVIFMGYSCNNNCIFCCNSERRKNIKDQSTSEIKQQILEAKRNGTSYLELIGGEPTIRKDILNIVKFAKDLNFETIMFATNGRMFSNKNFAKKVIESGVNHIVFSIHGHNSKLHDKLTKVPGSFNQLLKGVKNLREMGFKDIGSNTTIIKQNYKYLFEIGKKIYELGIRNSEFIFVDPTRGEPKMKFKEIVPTYEEVSPYVNGLLEFGKNKKISHWHVRYYPLCFVKEKYHDRISETHENKTFHTEQLAPDFVNREAQENRAKIGRVKIAKCEGCKHYEKCEGYWKEYAQQMLDNPKNKPKGMKVEYINSLFEQLMNLEGLKNKDYDIIKIRDLIFNGVKQIELDNLEISFTFSKNKSSHFRFVLYDSWNHRNRLFPDRIYDLFNFYKRKEELLELKKCVSLFKNKIKYSLGVNFSKLREPTIKVYFWLSNLKCQNKDRFDLIEKVCDILNLNFDIIKQQVLNKDLPFICLDFAPNNKKSIKVYTSYEKFDLIQLKEILKRNKYQDKINELDIFYNIMQDFIGPGLIITYRFDKSKLLSVKFENFIENKNFDEKIIKDLFEKLNYNINISILDRVIKNSNIFSLNSFKMVNIDFAKKGTKVAVYIKPKIVK